ncbi:MAG: WG repeat-containing protein [Bacteroidales bacterium]|nr:WG repeat-containing protein [Bacteroidales bacterium]
MTSFKFNLILLLSLLSAMTLRAQGDHDIQVIDDEACGCELYFIDGIQTTQQDGRFGFKRADGTVIVPNKYMFVDKFHGNYCIVYTDYYQTGIIDRTGREIAPCIYQDITYPSEGLIRVQRDGFFGYLDTTGRTVIESQYYSASGFFDGLAAVAVSPDSGETLVFGFIDTAARWVIQPRFQYAMPFTEGRAVVKEYDRYGMIDRTGREVLPIKYDYVSMLENGRFFALDPALDRLALFSKKKALTKFVYQDVLGYSEGLYLVVRDSLYGFIDDRGREVIPCIYSSATPMKDGFAHVSIRGRNGIIDRRGHVLLPLEYDDSGFRSEAYVFYEGLALVEKDGRYGYVDTKGNVVIPIKYESGYKFTEGIAPVSLKGSWGYIDHQGNTAIPFVFVAASPFEYGRAEVVFRGEVYKINPQGKCLKNCHGVKFF